MFKCRGCAYDTVVGNRRPTSVIALVLLAALAAALASNSRAPGIHGRVEEVVRDGSTTLRTVPRAGVDVLIVWRGDLLDNPVDSSRICLGAAHIMTNGDGSFSRPGWWKAPTWPPVTDVTVSAYVYSPGFMSVGPLFLTDEETKLLKPNVHLIKRDSGAPSREEWLQASEGCGESPGAP